MKLSAADSPGAIRNRENLQMGVHAAALALVVAAAHGRVIEPTSATAPLSDRVQKVRDELKAVADRVLHRSTSKGETAQPAFAGSWKTASTEGMDGYLDRAMGVGYLKRKIACKATQKQRLWQEGSVVHLEMTDKRGTARFKIRPDGKTYAGKGFMKLPMKQRARWDKGGVLVIDEYYFQHFGGAEHGQPASGDECPVIRSYRFVDKGGRMVVQLERRLLDGEMVGMKTYYTRVS